MKFFDMVSYFGGLIMGLSLLLLICVVILLSIVGWYMDWRQRKQKNSVFMQKLNGGFDDDDW